MTLGVALEAASCAASAWRNGASGTRKGISKRAATASAVKRERPSTRNRASFMVGNFQSVPRHRSEEHTSELQSRGLISYAVFCLKKKYTPYLGFTAFILIHPCPFVPCFIM